MATNARSAAAPILHLFRDILKVHRLKMAGPLRDIGDDYVKSEFKSHLRGKTTQAQWQQFVEQWRTYLSFVNGTAGAKAPMVNSSGELSEEVFEAMSPDQRQRMEALRKEAQRLGSNDDQVPPTGEGAAGGKA